MNKKFILMTFVSMFLFWLIIAPATNVFAWSNGGYSEDPSNPDYGTHDWIAQHALDWLPEEEKQYIANNLAAYLYGTELPDNPDGIGDTVKHHIYYNSSEAMTDDAAAVRASTEYSNTLSFLRSGDFAGAAKNAGIMSHYIVDVAVFGHVMGADTGWGAEQHHSDYESYVNERTSGYDAEFNVFLSFDDGLTIISAYDAAVYLAYDTTFDIDGDLTCVWMDQNYNWSDPEFRNRCGESLNLAVNLLADVLHTLYVEATAPITPDHIVINEFEQNLPGTDAEYEWVELFNPTDSGVDISGWTLSTTHGITVTITIPQDTIIDSYGYWTYTYDAQWLDNEEESVILRNAIGNEVDRTPTKSDTYNDNWCWARFPNGQDTDSDADWRFQASTKGYSNGKASSTITCTSPATTVDVDFGVNITATLSPALQGKTVYIEYSTDEATWNKLASGTTNSTGQYSYEWIPTTVQICYIRARWDGDNYYEGAVSEVRAIEVIPEFPATIVMSLLMFATLTAVTVILGKMVRLTS